MRCSACTSVASPLRAATSVAADTAAGRALSAAPVSRWNVLQAALGSPKCQTPHKEPPEERVLLLCREGCLGENAGGPSDRTSLPWAHTGTPRRGVGVLLRPSKITDLVRGWPPGPSVHGNGDRNRRCPRWDSDAVPFGGVAVVIAL